MYYLSISFVSIFVYHYKELYIIIMICGAILIYMVFAKIQKTEKKIKLHIIIKHYLGK